MKATRLLPDDVAPFMPGGRLPRPVARAVRVGERVHVGGANAIRRDGGVAGLGDPAAQAHAALDAIAAQPGTDQARVAEMIAYDRATIGGVIDRLVQKGWVHRVVSERDRRAREVSLTDEGQRVREAVLPVVQDLQQEILETLGDDERALFLALARKAVRQ